MKRQMEDAMGSCVYTGVMLRCLTKILGLAKSLPEAASTSRAAKRLRQQGSRFRASVFGF